MSPDDLARWRAMRQQRRAQVGPYASPSVPPEDPDTGWPVIAQDLIIMRGMSEEIRAEARAITGPGEVVPALEAMDDAIAGAQADIDQRMVT